MKTLISTLILLMVFLVATASCARSTASNAADNDATLTQSMKISSPATIETMQSATAGGFLAENWGALLMGLLGFYDVIARLTPTAKDNTIVTFLTKLLNFVIPNFKKGGGRL